MATFAKTSFDAAVYAASRPTYPKALFQFIFDYHERGVGALPRGPANHSSARYQLAVDLGCGTGQATTALHPFKRVIGVEPGEGMVEKAKSYIQEYLGGANTSQFDFVQSSAEQLDFLEDESVDLVISAQAAHWFDWNKQWREISRVLRPGGTIGFWTYSEFRLPQYPSLTPLITHYLQGRTILERHLIDIPEPEQVLGSGRMTNTDRVYFSGPYQEAAPSESPSPKSPTILPVVLRTQTTWNGLLGYFHTFSSLHTYLEQNPDDAKVHDGKSVAERTWEKLMQAATEESGKAGSIKGEDELMVEWPVAMILAKKL
ncbi:hypothetical protein D9757_004119 [Collybiopsis confluens]|uniref:Methyltransferase type 11 domain-containing protein n=1 Tax=Collybiopsis confluens TaxID=2823264 RepID=A0A8H5HUN9_9AGAR|nr:hypothetical protein D9757_004119 [Collybiopsis confluens]